VPIKNNVLARKGDLINPERKRRKKLGVKLGTGFEEDAMTIGSTPGSHFGLEPAKK
jgi:hypothetical protein